MMVHEVRSMDASAVAAVASAAVGPAAEAVMLASPSSSSGSAAVFRGQHQGQQHAREHV